MTEHEGQEPTEDDEPPTINEDMIGTVWTNRFGMTWACIYSEDLQAYVWWPLGRSDQ